MEVNYQVKLLLDILNKSDINDCNNINNILKFYIYLVLLSLNNHNYSDDIFNREHNIIDDFLRKVNNLKVKIQLNRKETEINNLIAELEKKYLDNKNLIDKYNIDGLDFNNIINSKDCKKITNFIDKLTLEKMDKLDSKKNDDDIRNLIDNNIFSSKYYIKDDIIYFCDNQFNTEISKFYQVFDYLLDIDNYKQEFLDNKVNRLHILLVNELIELIRNENIVENISDNQMVAILFNIIFNKNKINLDEIDTSNIKIDNIKISDLYSFAKNNESDSDKSARWNKVIIPNDYLYNKVKDLVQKGMYYIDNNNFTLENIDNRISDFKVSININEAVNLINNIIGENLESFSS